MENFDLDEEFVLLDPNVTTCSNGSFCSSISEDYYLEDNKPEDVVSCEIIGYPNLKTCSEEIGSHAKTFWTYFMLRTVFQWTMNSMYSLSDASALKLAEQHNSDYSYLLIYTSFANFLSPFLAGQLIKDSEEGSNGMNKFLNMFFMFVVDKIRLIYYISVPVLSFK